MEVFAEPFEGDDPILSPEGVQLLDALDSELERQGGDEVWGTDQYGIHTAGTSSSDTSLGVVRVYHPRITSDTVLRGGDGLDDETEERLNAVSGNTVSASRHSSKRNSTSSSVEPGGTSRPIHFRVIVRVYLDPARESCRRRPGGYLSAADEPRYSSPSVTTAASSFDSRTHRRPSRALCRCRTRRGRTNLGDILCCSLVRGTPGGVPLSPLVSEVGVPSTDRCQGDPRDRLAMHRGPQSRPREGVERAGIRLRRLFGIGSPNRWHRARTQSLRE